jgi:hypothetical protein
MSAKKKKKVVVKTFEYEDDVMPEAEELEMGEAVEVKEEGGEVENKVEQEVEQDTDDNFNLEWGDIYTFNMYN